MQNHFGAVKSEEKYYIDADLLREIKQVSVSLQLCSRCNSVTHSGWLLVTSRNTLLVMRMERDCNPQAPLSNKSIKTLLPQKIKSRIAMSGRFTSYF
jgi:hypothetical protein